MTEAKILPVEGKRNILLTSALPYVNNVPHLGNIIGSVLSADALSRYCKGRADINSLYICGTDEYGTATETAALAAGLTCQELCDRFYAIHTDIYKWFNIEFDYWGRTPTQQQTDITQDIFKKLFDNGYIEEKTQTQPFCEQEKHQAFLADRFVEGTCPYCAYEDARGDQCDKCGKLLDPEQLINPRCKVDGTTPVLRETKHLFISLNKLQPEVEEYFKKVSTEGKWSSNGIAITENWLKLGLEPRAITRDLKWGTPVPREGYEKKVFYVWFDACIGYVSITANYTDEWEKWWKNPDVKYYEFMGKDNVPFHSIIFPASQIGTRDPWTKVYNISTTEYLQYEGGKFSKSRGTGVFGDSAKATGLSSDIFRYYLLSKRPETGDTDFDWKSLILANNSELLNNLGNFVNRVLVFINKKYESTVPDYTKYSNPDLDAWKDEVNTLLKEYIAEFEEVKIRGALATAMRIAALGNKLLQSNTLDNKTLAAEPDKIATVIGLAVNLIYLLAAIIRPFTPITSDSILSLLKLSDFTIPDSFTGKALKPGHAVSEAQRLFAQIKPEQEEVWRDQFGGDEVRRQKEEKAAKAAKKAADKARKKEKKAAKTEGAEKDPQSVDALAAKVEDLRT